MRQQGRSLMWVGVLLAVIGLLAIVFPFVSGLAISLFIGAALVVGALLHLAHAFSHPGWKGSVWQIVLAVVYALAGILLLANPTVALVSLTLLLAAYLFLEGIVLVVMGFSMRGERSWGVTLVSGVLSLLIAGLVFVGFPSTAAWAIGLLVGVNLLTTGVALIFAGREASKMTEPVSPMRPEPGTGV